MWEKNWKKKKKWGKIAPEIYITGALFDITGAESPSAPVYFGPCLENIPLKICVMLGLMPRVEPSASPLCTAATAER